MMEHNGYHYGKSYFEKPNYLKMKRLLLQVALFLFCILLNAQVPQGFNYQAIARDEAGDPIINTTIPVQLTIQSDTLGGTVFWQELHSEVTTNNIGLFTLIVGKGVKQSGEAATFDAIDWTVTPKFIKTEVDFGGWINMGSSRLWAVPYSMVAKDLSGSVNKLTVEGETTSMEEALFEVKNKNGQTVFAVYNEGVRIYVDDGDAKGLKGGFAIGGLNPAKGTGDLFIVNADSIRAYINDLPGKSTKGGFAIGGFDAAKGALDNYLKVDVEKINAGKVEYLDITPYNLFIGEYAGENTEVTFGAVPSLNTGVDNVFIGNQSGYQNTSGLDNVFIGYQSGMNNVEGVSNVFIGNQAGATNIGIGDYIGDYNVFIGYLTGFYNTDGQSNVFVGKQSGFRNTTGRYNTFLGQNSGAQNLEGNFNTFVGGQAATYKTGGSNNTIIGYYAGASNADGSGNVFIGRQAGSAETGSNLLYIENSSTTTPLIGGNFTSNMVAINGLPDVASASFQVNGSTRLGNYGTTINNIIKLTITADIDPVPSNSSLLKTFSVPHATTDASVIVSPQNVLPDGLVISYARVSFTGIVEVKYRNTTATTIDLASMDWYITVFQ